MPTTTARLPPRDTVGSEEHPSLTVKARDTQFQLLNHLDGEADGDVELGDMTVNCW